MQNSSILYLSLDEALAIHQAALTRFGGATGVRDFGLLQSALFRPQSGYYDGLESMAAALFESLLINHPFVDGNKRVAFFATDVFLRINGYKLKLQNKEAHRFLIGLLERGECNFDNLLPWIKEHAVSI